MRLRVLVIDDDEAVRERVRMTLESADEQPSEQGWKVFDYGFEGVRDSLLAIRPDVVILDLVDGEPPDGQPRGNVRFREIRDTWFCPVVVYSAFPNTQDFGHPLVHTVVKAADALEKVLMCLAELAPMARAIRSVHNEFDSRIRKSLHDSVGILREQIGEESDDEPLLRRAVRRLVAAGVDAGDVGVEGLAPWERFVIPPLGGHLLTADILKEAGAEWNSEESFRVVLTPSCDLVPGKWGRPKAHRVLVACCEQLTRLGKIQLKPGERLKGKRERRIRRFLNDGMVDGFLPIPKFQGHVPLMVANLKALELIEWQKVSLAPSGGNVEAQDSEFERVASTDSPFREMVVWAYLRVTGRPGVPEIDVEQWLSDISDHFEQEVHP